VLGVHVPLEVLERTLAARAYALLHSLGVSLELALGNLLGMARSVRTLSSALRILLSPLFLLALGVPLPDKAGYLALTVMETVPPGAVERTAVFSTRLVKALRNGELNATPFSRPAGERDEVLR